MTWREVTPIPMSRVAVVATMSTAGDVLAAVAAAGVFEPDEDRAPSQPGVATVDERLASAISMSGCPTLTGWMPRAEVEPLRTMLSPLGGGVAAIPVRRGAIVPTAHAPAGIDSSLRPLVTTYGTIPPATSIRRCSLRSPTCSCSG
ncbi:MAG: hypothetical protein R2710_29685 [Acidimicrobiales bacterium]